MSWHWQTVLAILVWAACSQLASSQGTAISTVAPVTAAPVSSDGGGLLLCMAEMVSSIENSCANPDSQKYYVALESLLKQYLGKCFQSNFTATRALHLMLPALEVGSTSPFDYTAVAAANFSAASDIEVVPTFVPAIQVNAEIEFELVHNLAYSHDAWVFDPSGITAMMSQKGLMDLTDFAVSSPLLNWPDVHVHLRRTATSYLGRTVVLPLDANMGLLYYRRDVFTAQKLAIPNTWDEVVAIAQSWNGTIDLDGNPNNTDYVVCMETRSACPNLYADLMSILAPMLQYSGTSQGAFFDPTLLSASGSLTAALLMDAAPLGAAINTYTKLAALAAPTSPLLALSQRCDFPRTAASAFASGRCLMTFGLGGILKETQLNYSRVHGSVGVAQLPGSYSIFNRATGTMTPCTAALCPYAVPVDVNGTTQYLNRAPFAAGGGWVSGINLRSQNELLNTSTALLASISSPANAWALALNKTMDFEPYRYSQMDPNNIGMWQAAGFNPDDTLAYLAATRASFDNPNIVLDLRVPNAASYKALYSAAVLNASSGAGTSEVVTALQISTVRLMSDAQQTNLAVLADAYKISIGFIMPQPPAPPPAPAPPSSKSGGSPSWLPVAIVLPTVTVLLLMAAGVMYEVRNSRRHRNMFGHVVAPGVGADMTILVTGIQDAEVLHDSLTPEVMAVVEREFTECLRRLMAKHSGYESSWANDSFTIAFHSPKDALLFALEAQAALVNVEWPAEVLALPCCAPLVVKGMVVTSRPANELVDILDIEGEDADGDVGLATGQSKIKALAPGFTSLPLGGTMGALLPSWAAGAGGTPQAVADTFAMACTRAWKEITKGGEEVEPQFKKDALAKDKDSVKDIIAVKDTDDKDKMDGEVVLYRGPRLSVGLHAGTGKPITVVRGKGEQRTTYSGEGVDMARLVCSTAPGGTIFLSEDTYKKLPLERLWDKYLVLHVGEHRLTSTLLPNGTDRLALYHALNRTLEGRLAYTHCIKSEALLDPGVMDAPVGCVTVAFQNVVGAQTLLSWNAGVAQTAIKRFHTVVGEELKRREGYLVEAVDGLFLASFRRPAQAIRWAMECNEHMITQDWPEELLSHELCEELVVSAPNKAGEVINTIVFRGLRLKAGVDTGPVLGEVHAMTGRMTYRGKVMNRAARIASTASTGQVLCSSDTWQMAAAQDAQLLTAAKLSATSLGKFRLKGVAEKMEIYHCRKTSHVAPARRASVLLAMGALDQPWGKLNGWANDLAGQGSPGSPSGLYVQQHGQSHHHTILSGHPDFDPVDDLQGTMDLWNGPGSPRSPNRPLGQPPSAITSGMADIIKAALSPRSFSKKRPAHGPTPPAPTGFGLRSFGSFRAPAMAAPPSNPPSGMERINRLNASSAGVISPESSVANAGGAPAAGTSGGLSMLQRLGRLGGLLTSGSGSSNSNAASQDNARHRRGSVGAVEHARAMSSLGPVDGGRSLSSETNARHGPRQADLSDEEDTTDHAAVRLEVV